MDGSDKSLSVTQAAALCRVGRTTVGYWIRSNKLPAGRKGKKYEIPVQDLLYFLKAGGHKIPIELEKKNLNGPVFRTFQHCWQHYQGSTHGLNCHLCVAFQKKLQVCFSARNSGALNCLESCETCGYYQETYYPRLQFIHQFDIPAAVVKDLYFWAGNLEMANLCEVEEKDLVGMGIEKIVHPNSLELVISGAKRKALGDPGEQTECSIYVKNRRLDKIKTRLSVFLLKEPPGAFLILAKRELNNDAGTCKIQVN
jgi:excisionase family DNA binding protein